MATLVSSATIVVEAADTEVEQVEVVVLPVAGPGTGPGRIDHPTLGSFTYEFPPDEWTNYRGDVVVAPVWAMATSLTSATATLWAGNIRDVECEERWIDSAAMTATMFDAMLALWQTPVDPADGYIEWWPSYASDLGYKVAIVGMSAGGSEITLTSALDLDCVEGPVAWRLRILGRVDPEA